MSSITFVVPVGSEELYGKCFLSSPLFAEGCGCQVIAQRGFKTAGQAFNDGIEGAANDVVVFAHQDVVLPAGWARLFSARLKELESQGAPVGVVGCVGITLKGEPVGHIYRYDRELFPDLPLPARIETLDEMLVCFRKSSGLRFDPKLPSFF